MSASIIISAYNQPLQLGKCLASLLPQSHRLGQVIVSEDARQKETEEVIRRFAPKMRAEFIHITTEKVGSRQALARNRAIHQVGAEQVIQIDGDCVLHPRFVQDHIERHEPGSYIQGYRTHVKMDHVTGFDHRFHTRWSYLLRGRLNGGKWSVRALWRVNRSKDYQCALGVNMSFSLEDLRGVNGYDTSFSGWGVEDVDLTGRLHVLGIRTIVLERLAILYHLDHPTRAGQDLDDKRALVQKRVNERIVHPQVGLNAVKHSIPETIQHPHHQQFHYHD